MMELARRRYETLPPSNVQVDFVGWIEPLLGYTECARLRTFAYLELDRCGRNVRQKREFLHQKEVPQEDRAVEPANSQWHPDNHHETELPPALVVDVLSCFNVNEEYDFVLAGLPPQTQPE